MSAAAAVFVDSPVYPEIASAPRAPSDVQDFIHQLRQPLSSIEAIAYYMEMTLPAGQSDARQYMRRIQQLVEEAHAIVREAAMEITPRA